jgi:transposase-like protein
MENTEARPRGRPPKETAEFRAEAVRLVEEGGQSLRQAARDLGLSVETLRRWVQHAKTDAGKGAAGALTKDERAELRRSTRSPCYAGPWASRGPATTPGNSAVPRLACSRMPPSLTKSGESTFAAGKPTVRRAFTPIW